MQTARQRAQENEAWRCVRKHAALILQQLKPGEAVAVPAIVVRPAFQETQERWITLQFLVISYRCERNDCIVCGRQASLNWHIALFKFLVGQRHDVLTRPDLILWYNEILSIASQEIWGLVMCSSALKASAHLSNLSVQPGTPVNLNDENHERFADWKRYCWMLWFEISGEAFTQAMFTQLQKLT